MNNKGSVINTMVGIVAFSGLFLIIINALPFSVSLPEEVMQFFEENPLQKIYNYANFFFPIGFCLKMLVLVWLSNYVSLFFKMLVWIYRRVAGL